MQDLKITFIQSSLYWHDVDANLASFEEKIWQINTKPDIIFLPEMFTTGFTNDCATLAEVMNMKSTKWLIQMAKQTGACLAGSVIIKEGETYYNRLIWAYPNGEIDTYDKRHLFSLAREDEYYGAGDQRLIVDVKGWKLCPMICYDLRFPVYSRNNWQKNQEQEYDVLVYLANWPKVRVHAWDTLLKARAIENLSYVVGLNRIGKDGKGHEYPGHSAVIDPLGGYLIEPDDLESIQTTTLSSEELKKVREKIPFYKDSDDFNLI